MVRVTSISNALLFEVTSPALYNTQPTVHTSAGQKMRTSATAIRCENLTASVLEHNIVTSTVVNLKVTYCLQSSKCTVLGRKQHCWILQTRLSRCPLLWNTYLQTVYTLAWCRTAKPQAAHMGWARHSAVNDAGRIVVADWSIRWHQKLCQPHCMLRHYRMHSRHQSSHSWSY